MDEVAEIFDKTLGDAMMRTPLYVFRRFMERLHPDIDFDALMSLCPHLQDQGGSINLKSFLAWLQEPIPPPPRTLWKSSVDPWWQWAAPRLRSCILQHDFEDDVKWADSFTKFITQGLAAVRWIAEDSDRALGVTTKEEYTEEYAGKLAGRSDVQADNLWQIKCMADRALEMELSNSKASPEHLNLVREIFQKKEVLKWSQGGFGPQTYHHQFLSTYANAMVSDVLWQQSEKTYGDTYAGARKPLECGIFFVQPSVEYPLHYHEELEAYYILAGKTRFVWLHDGNLVYLDREAGEWHFNPPFVPHAVTSPHGEVHCSLWFREGGSGQVANNRFGPKWIADVDGLDWMEEDDSDGEPDGQYVDDEGLIGSLGFKRGCVFRSDCKKHLRLLTPMQFEYLNNCPEALKGIDDMLDPRKKEKLQKTLNDLRSASKRQAQRRLNNLSHIARLAGQVASETRNRDSANAAS